MNSFTKKESMSIKGIAILMMIWHHCFLAGRFEDYEIVFLPLAQSQVVNVASFCKICVSLFAFVSGYGLYISFIKDLSQGGHWIKNRLIRLLSGYWFIVLLAWIVCFMIDGRTYTFYFEGKNVWLGIWTMLMEFFGLAKFLNLSVFNGDWWYISAAVVFVVLVPVLSKSLEFLGSVSTIALCIIIPRLMGDFYGGTHWVSFLPVFVLGMIAAKEKLFEKWNNWTITRNKKQSNVIKVTGLFILCVLGYKFYYHLPTQLYWEVKYAFIPIVIIIFAKEYIIPLPIVGKVLEFLGKPSMNIWLIHNFIRGMYGKDFIYGLEHFAVIMLMLLIISLAASIVIEFLKKLLGYEKIIQKLIEL